MPDPPGTDWLKTQTNYQNALRELKLTPQEQYAYQHHLRNRAMGGVKQPGGDISTYLSKSFTFGKKNLHASQCMGQQDH